MVRMSKEVKKGLRREAMKSIRVAFQIMDESTSLEILERRYRIYVERFICVVILVLLITIIRC